MKTALISIFAFALAASFSSCAPKKHDEAHTDMINIPGSANTHAPKGTPPVMKFTEEMHDFGKISQGERVTYAFEFINTGGSDLLISDAHGSCGCTVPDYPKKPIHPGEKGVVNVEFNSEGKRDKQEKTITLTTNCVPNTQVITIRAEVINPK